MHVCLVVCDSLQHHGVWPTRLHCLWDFPGKNNGVDCRFLLQGIFPTQRLNPYLLHWQVDFSSLNHQGSTGWSRVAFKILFLATSLWIKIPQWRWVALKERTICRRRMDSWCPSVWVSSSSPPLRPQGSWPSLGSHCYLGLMFQYWRWCNHLCFMPTFRISLINSTRKQMITLRHQFGC